MDPISVFLESVRDNDYSYHNCDLGLDLSYSSLTAARLSSVSSPHTST